MASVKAAMEGVEKDNQRWRIEVVSRNVLVDVESTKQTTNIL